MKKYIIGIDVGGTKMAVTLADFDANFLAKEQFATAETKSPRETVEKTFGIIKKILEEKKLSVSDVSGIGISCGGPLDDKRGVILSPPNLPGWDEVPITKWYEDEFKIPAYLKNDADACAIAEWKFGAGRGCENMVFLTFGTGLGAGLILNGKLYTGTANFAGEIGHVRLEKHGPVGYGKSGSAEGFCSGNGIAQLAKTRVLEQLQSGKTTVLAANTSDAAKITAKDVSIAATNGDELSLSIFAEVGEQFGRVLAVLADVLNPELVVAGGVYMRAHQFMDDAMWRAIRREALPGTAQALHVLPSLLGEKIGDYAALTVAVNGLKNA